MSATAAPQATAETVIDTIRTLSMDAVQAANCGHPGTPMALAPIAYELWANAMNYDPTAPDWPNRDRYVLSCGHASMLIYSVLHLTGVKKPDGTPSLTLQDLKDFRQLGSPTPGHPEAGDTVGVETTTGPLGQGCGNSVGMAIAGRWLAARYNTAEHTLFDYNVYTQCSDGDLMEGVACEAASLAGHLGLANLCWIYDDNQITIEGSTDLAFSEDVARRFEGLGWAVHKVDDANDRAALAKAIAAFQAEAKKPTLLVVKSVIAYGAPNKAGTAGAHGSPLGDEEISATKKAYGWPDEKFLIPEGVYEHFEETLGARGAASRSAWEESFAAYKKANPELGKQVEQIAAGELPAGWDADLPEFPADDKGIASRASAGQALTAIAPNLPWLIGGSADLAPSTNTLLKFDGAGHFQADTPEGRNLHFGIREHGMAAAANGMALCGVRPYVATFFVFSDYCRPSLRLSSIMHQPVVYVFTHDSIGVGEDGPTHQPVEQLAACRAIPGLIVIRPGDANEAAQAWKAAIESQNRPTALILTRQKLPTLDRSKYGSAEGVVKGGYVLAEADGGKPKAILMASGSEVSIAVEAGEKLNAAGVPTRVVSMPSFDLFEDQDTAYRESVLPSSVAARVAVEAGVRQGWDRYLGSTGEFVGMTGFGASGPGDEVYQHFGVTADAVVAKAKSLI